MQLEFVEPQQLASTAIQVKRRLFASPNFNGFLFQNEHKLRPAINSDYRPTQLTFMRRSGYRSWHACDTDKGVGEMFGLNT